MNSQQDSDQPQQISVADKPHQQSQVAIPQPQQTAPTELADPDSMFAQIEDVFVHYKVWASQPSSPASINPQVQVPNYSSLLVCLHGFGASLFSFELAKKALLRISPEVGVMAYDTPGFGITTRSRRLECYSPKFSARICTTIADAVAPTASQILVAHSMGALTACRVVLSNPSRYSTLILVAPALVPSPKNPSSFRHPFHMMLSGVMSIVVAFSYILSPILLLLLQVIVQNRAFWRTGLTFARDASNPVTEEIIDGYRKPINCEGWRRGILNFVRSTLLEQTHALKASEDFVNMLSEMGPEALRILIIHGASDAIVPLDNSKTLAERLPNVELAILPKCGHVPHEEDPEAFATIIRNFLIRADYV